jgi:hypothetical protein
MPEEQEPGHDAHQGKGFAAETAKEELHDQSPSGI